MVRSEWRRRELAGAFAAEPRPSCRTTSGTPDRQPHPRFVPIQLIRLGGLPPAASIRWSLVAAALASAVASTQARAQPAPVPPLPRPPPSQEGIIERLAPVQPPQLAPPLQPPPEQRATGPGEARTVHVARVVLRGNQAVPDAALRPILAPIEGQTVTLGRIEEARLEVLRAYRVAGYPYTAVAAALAPTPEGAELRILVTEGYVAEVKLDGDIGPAGTQALRFLERLVGQRPLTNAALERALLLVSDIPGVAVRGVLRPTTGDPGALQLVAQLSRRPVSGYFNLDNRGYPLTGEWQGLLVAGLNSFTAFGERIEVAILESEANNQTFGQVSGEVFVGGSGLRVRLYAGAGRVRPGSPLAALGYEGDTWVAGIAATYPVIRSRSLNLSVTGQFDLFESTVDVSPGGVSQRASRDAIRTLRVGAEGSVRDTLLGFAPAAAVTTAAFRLSQGIEGLGSTRSGDPMAGRAGSDFGFTKLSGEVVRNQPLLAPLPGWVLGVNILLAGQWTNDVLPLAEKFYLGGARLGRGFYSGQLTGDKGFGAALELQLSTAFSLDRPALLGGGETQLATQFYLFRDQGWTWENRAADPDRRMESWGGGVRIVFDDWLQFDVEGVHRITRSPEASGAAVRREDANAVFGRMLVRF